VAFQYLNGAYKQEGEWLFTWVDSDSTPDIKENKCDPGNYHHVSLTPVLGVITEQILLEVTLKHTFQ